MSRRTADPRGPPSDGDDREIRSVADSSATLTHAAHRGEEQINVADTESVPFASTQTGDTTIAAADPAASGRPFDRLATVELQLIMRCCDQPTLIALARCSRFTLAAASHPFAWQPLSPIALQCDWPLELSGRLRPKKSPRGHQRQLAAAVRGGGQC